VLVLALALAGPAAGEETPTLVGDEAEGTVQLAGQRRLLIEGIQGTLVVRSSGEGDLRYAARQLADRSAAQPVRLWAEGPATLRLTPAEGGEAVRTRLEVIVPPGLHTEVTTADSNVEVSAIGGNFRLVGGAVQLQARAVGGSLEVQQQGGLVAIDGLDGALDVQGAGLTVRLQNVRAPARIDLEGSTLTMSAMQEAVEGVLERTPVSVRDVEGAIRLEIEGGEVDLARCNGGGELRLTGAPLRLASTMGVLDVETDGPVQFDGHDGSLKIVGFGAAVTGTNTAGMLEIETDNAEVKLDALGGSTAIRGRGLKVDVARSRGELRIATTASNVRLEACDTVTVIENEFGDVEIQGASQPLDVVSRDGDVRITELRGTLQLKAAGPEVEVVWDSFNIHDDSVIENQAGDVRLGLPGSTSCRVEAEARGQVESDLSGVLVSDDGHFASGLLGNAARTPHVKQPGVQVYSAGDLYLTDSSSE
jgi:hypothetical protein